MSITVLIADDHAVVRNGVRSVLERHSGIEVIAEASTGEEALSVTECACPDVALIDIVMPGLNGFETTTRILRTSPAIRVGIMSVHTDDRFVFAALHAGAKAYLSKLSLDEYLVESIQSMMNGRRFVSPDITESLGVDTIRSLDDVLVQDSCDLITDREKEVLRLLAEGKSNRHVASDLGVSIHTAETHRRHLMQKLNLHSTAEIVLYAVRKRIVS